MIILQRKRYISYIDGRITELIGYRSIFCVSLSNIYRFRLAG